MLRLAIAMCVALGLTACGDDDADSTSGEPPGDLCERLAAADCPPFRIISGDDLDTILSEPGLKLIDTRSETDHATSRIGTAAQLDPGLLRAEVDGIAGQVAPVPDVEAAFSAIGLLPTDDVVVYGAGNTTDVARVVWTLAYHGHEGAALMLDGGFAQWTAEDRAIEAGAPTAPEASTYVASLVEERRVDSTWVLDHLDDRTVTLFDARSADEYDGGHIPGAVNVDWNTTQGAGVFLAAEDLRTLHGEPPTDQTLVTYCQTGSRASVTWLVLAALGYEDVRLYDGSWAEWGSDPMLPSEP